VIINMICSNALQQTQFWVCSRCHNEGVARAATVHDAVRRHELLHHIPMKYSRQNTRLYFRYHDIDDPMQGLSVVEESLIALISALVTVQRIEGI